MWAWLSKLQLPFTIIIRVSTVQNFQNETFQHKEVLGLRQNYCEKGYHNSDIVRKNCFSGGTDGSWIVLSAHTTEL